MIKADNRLYEFGPFRLDPVKRLLWRDGELLAVRAKTFDTLLALVRSNGRVMEKEELMKEVWGETIVEESGLARNISELRKMLGENRGEHRYIVTAPGRGYQFVAPVREIANQTAVAEIAAEQLIEETHTVSVIITQEDVSEPDTVATRQPSNGLPTKLPTGLLAAGSASGAQLELTSPATRQRLTAVRLGAGLAVMELLVAVFFFYFQPRPALTEKDTILLADFANATGDAAFDDVLKQGLAVQLEQSPFLNTFPEALAQETLRMMNRQPDEPITPAIAREICQRQGIKAALSGAVTSLGSHYVITLEAINAQTGAVIARDQVEAESKEQVLRALSRAAKTVREQLGESLSSIEQFSAPIEQATTGSLDALRAYSLGREELMRGNGNSAIQFYERAVALDANFATAWSALADLEQHRDLTTAQESITKAYALRERLGEVERVRITATYHELITKDIDKVIAEGELWRRNYPRSWRPYWGLAVSYYNVGQNEKALENAREALRLNPYVADHYDFVAKTLLTLGRFAEVAEVYRSAQFTPAVGHARLYLAADALGDAALRQQQLEWAAAGEFDYLGHRWQADTAARAGQWRRMQELARTGAALAVRRNAPEQARWLEKQVLVTGALVGDCRTVLQQDETGLIAAQRLDWLTEVAIAHALCGQPAKAQAFIEQYQTRYPQATLLQGLYLPSVRAAIALAQDAPDRALKDLESTKRFAGVRPYWPAWLRGQAYLRLQQSAPAAAAFEQMLEQRGWYLESPLYALAHLGLARALWLSGETAKSRQAYEAFFALWKEADPDLPLLKKAQTEYASLGLKTK